MSSSFGKVSSPTAQPESFAFTPENVMKAEAIIAKYPGGKQQSAIMPLLWLAQKQNDNWLPKAAMDHVADMLKVPRIRVYEVATFYTQYNKEPVGRNFIQVCTTTPCWLRGSDGILDACRSKLGIGPGEHTADGKFSVVEVECLGACVNAPMVQINDEYYEDLTPEIMGRIIDRLAQGEEVPMGSQQGRKGAMAQAGSTSLREKAEKLGIRVQPRKDG
jgi:NADH-quinone oxidoreductase E subunit